ncbi:MAG: ribbon-helix-helix domain-containing protein [Xenococcaceae cyanobacterium MO_188.B32]|nr:ribbon-helix-helix domain-containing protein [Xenococcaceae cyanobacterium MO_188.B32]
MPQVKVTLEGKAIEFIDNHKKYGYSSRTELVRDAIALLQQQLEQKELEESARIYQQIYEEDTELQELTDGAATEWLE